MNNFLDNTLLAQLWNKTINTFQLRAESLYYISTKTYAVDDVVAYNNKLYQCIQTSTGNLPTNTTYWSIFQGGGGGATIIETTHSNLKAARDGGDLIPGCLYRITDYQCTTIAQNTSSAGHQFDIILLATSVSTLAEDALAALHSGDTYFANSNFSAWKLKYNLDGTNVNFCAHKAIIFQYKTEEYYYEEEDEYEYDYDTITCIRYPAGDSGNNIAWAKVYDGAWEFEEVDNWADVDSSTIVYTSTESPTVGTIIYYSGPIDDEGEIIQVCTTDNKGVIYYMKDEFNNECPYDFKNILFTASFYYSYNNYTYTYTDVYTFNYVANNINKDASLVASKDCHDNIIKPGFSGHLISLNCNIFSEATGCYDNIFDNSCYYNLIWSNSQHNTFGVGCNHNILSNRSMWNKFGNSCASNVLSNSDCKYNILDDLCYSNSFTSGSYNILGQECSGNVLGFKAEYNVFGNHCSNIKFGYSFTYNTFGTYCTNIIFGTDANNLIQYGRAIKVSNFCAYLNIISADTSATYSNYLQNIYIQSGIRGAYNAQKTVTIPDRGLACETEVYQDTTGNLIYRENNSASIIDLR